MDVTPPAATRPAQTLVLDDFPRPVMARALSPNGRVHWAQKNVARHYVQDQVVVAVITSHLSRMRGLVTIWPTFIFPVARKRDDDNLATGVMKAVRDTLVGMDLLEADDIEHLRQMPVEVRVEKGRRALELRFEVDLLSGRGAG